MSDNERASLPDRVEAAPRRMGTGPCANCGWIREAVLFDGRIVFNVWHSGLAGVSEPKKCYECRAWSSMPALAVADACEAERADEYVKETRRLYVRVPEGAYDLYHYVPYNHEVFRRRPVSSEDVHREAAE